MAPSVPPSSSASAIGGIWFVFQHAGQSVALWVSSFTGKEELHLNGALSSERRKIALSSSHEFELNGSRYVLNLATRNLRRGVFECALRENGQVVAVQQTEYVAKRRWQQSLLVGIGSAFFAVLAFNGTLPGLASVAGIALVAGLSFSLFGHENGYVISPVAPSALGSGSEGGIGEA